MPVISALTELTTADDADQLAIVDTSEAETKRITVGNFIGTIRTLLTGITGFLGWGQTWQNVLASRAVSTSYQNTTGRPIQVCISWGAASGIPLQMSVDNATWISVAQTSSAAGTSPSAIIPNNWYYRVNGAVAIAVWAELR